MKSIRNIKIKFNFIQEVFYSKGVLFLYLLLALLSAITVSSAISSEVYKRALKGGFSTIIPIGKHILFLFLGGLIVYYLPRYLKVKYIFRTTLVYFICIFISLVLVLVVGVKVNGASRWFIIGGVSIQPSEFYKLALISTGAMAGYLVQIAYRSGQKNYAKSLINIFWGGNLLAIFFVFIGNFSSALLFVIFMILYSYVMKFPPKYVNKFLILIICAGGLFIICLFIPGIEKLPFLHRAPTWKNRIVSIIHSPEDPYKITDSNRQLQLSKIAIAEGHILGKGSGNSMMKRSLPMAYSDFIMAIGYEEYGIFSVIFVVIVFSFWLILGRSIGIAAGDKYFQKYLAYGVGLFYPLQALMNLSVAAGVFMTGQTLPIISAGGSSIISTSFALAILSMIARKQSLEKQKQLENNLNTEDVENTYQYEEENVSTNIKNNEYQGVDKEGFAKDYLDDIPTK